MSKLKQIYIENYTLGTSYSNHEKKVECVYLSTILLKFSKIDLNKFCQDKNIEICALKIKINFTNICIIAIYRAPTGHFNQFINSLDSVLKKLYTPTSQFIICGDINIIYLIDNEKKNQLNALLLLYNLSSIVHFPTRIQNKSATIIDNIFIDINIIIL
jgi:exonuclease III